ncbi:MAG: phosphatase PAP2 family protein [Methanobacterium sp.]|uniref:phosphatase PAP2 family protein n=1 Tax=Methanobacterium sp. TaxID=2164 RepID=UPI003D654906|nr:phosphatase PAP2 family protein [Methanobacterium sp.]
MKNNVIMDDGVKKRFAEFISIIAYAPTISIPAFAIINYYLLNIHDFLIVTCITTVFAGLLPILLVYGWMKSKKTRGMQIELDIPERTDRNVPLLMVIISYLIGAVILYMINAPTITTILMFCYFSNTLIVFFINLYWKISIHSMGVAGPAAALIYVFGPIGVIFSTIIPVVMWSRLYLKRHTLLQVISGALLGLISTAIQIMYFTKIIHL